MSIIESCTLPPVRPRRTRGNPIPRNFRAESLSPFGRVCVALWGFDKPGVALSQKAGCTYRQANLYIEGKTPPSYEVLMVVLDELRPRKRA
ncbi:hypothetical protein [Bradyrhizobium sp. 150]|uniref:hypothetical protein n=1 Tax=Bradyrhizobium sp. 150 TaxID=2782625 RepID=UPI001FFBD151|nr:hypothetical protein [Bradyrhizobium sp. 150]MCK1676595.1 hypothetical protein [Bradyrhizobium sp. 150]